MKIAIYGQYYHNSTHESIEILLEALIRKNVEVFIENDFFNIIKHESNQTSKLDDFDTFESLDDLVFIID